MTESRPRSSRGSVNRRVFLQGTAAAGAAAGAATLCAAAPHVLATEKPALLGGTPVRHSQWPSWPVTDRSEESALLEVLRSGDWFRYQSSESGTVDQWEQLWAKSIGTSYCQAVANGTSALITSLAALQIGPGDEVLVPPYTFIATVNAVLLHHALPVFVDSDLETAQMDAGKIEERVTQNTRAVIPVHLAGAPCDMDRILSIAKKHSLKVIEDACQAHTGEWKGRRVGSIGDAGCFSFQNSKNITSGEGGAVTTNDRMLYARAQSFHHNGLGTLDDDGSFTSNGANLRLTEFQAAILLQQHRRLHEQSRIRETNAAYLNSLLEAVPGIRVKKTYPGTTRHGYHLYMFDYDPDRFAGIGKPRVLEALRAEGIPVSGGYQPTNKMPFVKRFLESPGFQRIYSADRLRQYREQNHCSANDQLCKTTMWLGQNVLLSAKADMEDIANALEKVQKHAAAL